MARGKQMEVIGIIASIMVLATYIVKSPLAFRVIAIIGGILYILYGIYLHSFSTVFMNCSCLVINVFNILKLSIKNEEHSKNKVMRVA